MKNAILLAVCFILTFISATAESAYDLIGFHKHDGSYISISAGPIFGSIREEPNTTFISEDALIYSGTGTFFEVKYGTRMEENTLLHFTVLYSSVIAPEVGIEWSSDKVRLSSNSSLNEAMFGLGVTHYYMPENYFLSVSGGFGVYSYSENAESHLTEFGVGFQLKVGKEWWVSKNWGLGAALSISTTLASTAYSSLSSGRCALVFNATYN